MSIYCDKCGARHDSSVCPSCGGFGKNPPMTADDVRARLEQIATRVGFFLLRADENGIYNDPYTHGAWEFYRAAHADLSGEVRELVADALRRAAQVIELYDDATMRSCEMATSTDCAEILNALADQAALAKFAQEKP